MRLRAGGSLVVIAQWQSTGCTSQVSWVQFLATVGLFSLQIKNLFVYLQMEYVQFNFQLLMKRSQINSVSQISSQNEARVAHALKVLSLRDNSIGEECTRTLIDSLIVTHNITYSKKKNYTPSGKKK